MGVGRPALSRVFNGKASISPEMAIRFERMGWLVAGVWVARQARWDLARAYDRLSKEEKEELERMEDSRG